MLCRDTVDSVGIIPRRLPFTTSNTIVRTFRQALALDERRVNFGANGWNNPSDREAELGVHQMEGHDHVHARGRVLLKRRETTGSVIDVEYDGMEELSDLEERYATNGRSRRMCMRCGLLGATLVGCPIIILLWL
jgi:uncharacterized protein (DUF2235 family)